MAKKTHVSETPATQLLRANGIAFTEHPYEYLAHGGAQHSAEVLGLDPFTVVKTLVMQDQDAKPLIVLCHGGPIATPEDAQYVLARCPSCHGFYGASSMERLPTEVALTETTRRFVAIAR